MDYNHELETIFVGLKKDEPYINFLYKPIKILPDYMKVQIIEGETPSVPMEPYTLYFTLGSAIITIDGLALKIDPETQKVIFFVKDTHLEQRKYPRFKVQELGINVYLRNLKGVLVDISRGGCRIFFPSIRGSRFIDMEQLDKLEFILPNGKTYKLKARMLSFNPETWEASFAFIKGQDGIPIMLKEILDMLKAKKKGYDIKTIGEKIGSGILRKLGIKK